MSTALHSCIEAAYGYCDALARTRDPEHEGSRVDEPGFDGWLELQRNWLLVALRESFALEYNDGCEELSEEDVLRMLAESDARRETARPRKKQTK